jgi:uncharacterized protein UPF0164
MKRPEENSMRCAKLVTNLNVVLLLTLGLPAGAFAAAGETGFAFLKLGVGARPMGMGSAYVALADDPTAIHWNPAGLASVEGTQLTAMHNEWIQDFRQEFAAVAFPLLRGSVGVAFSGFYTSEFEKRDDTGVLIGHFGFNDLSASAAYARRFSPRATAGLAVKYVREMIDAETATSVAFDAGARYALPSAGLSFGGAVQNVGGDATFVSEAFPLPRTLRAGVAWTRALSAWQGRGTLSGEVRQAKGEDARLHLGGEFDYREQLALRAGVKFGYDDETMSFGLGVKRGRFGLDYALVPLTSDLGTTHFVSVTARL